MNITQLESFKTLLTAWRDHQELKDDGAPIADLADSRARLDAARLHANIANSQLLN